MIKNEKYFINSVDKTIYYRYNVKCQLLIYAGVVQW